MYWLKPINVSKVYEALSAIADKRFVLIEDGKARCTSSSKGKYYDIEYNRNTNEIMSNDNMAYYKGEVSYPMIAMLLENKVIEYDRSLLDMLKDIKWKDLNQKNKNDYMKSVEEVLRSLSDRGVDTTTLEEESKRIYDEVCNIQLKYLGKRTQPPSGY